MLWVRVMVEQGKKRAVAAAFDWPGWDRSGKSEADALAVLDAYRSRYAPVAALAGLGNAFEGTEGLEVVERLAGTGMTDFHGVSARAAAAEQEQMDEGECGRKLALLRASWAYFDDVASRVSGELRKGPRGGGRDRDPIIGHANRAEIQFARKVGVRVPLETWEDASGLRTYREAFIDAIREANTRGPAARSWTVQFLVRRCAYHMLDHAWEMEDRDLSGAG